jgi:hypothetical protein
VLALQRTVGNRGIARAVGSEPGAVPLQRMSVRNAPTGSVVSGTTRTRHVEPNPVAQQTAAVAGFGSRTFVAADADLTGPVDLDAHNFAQPQNQRGARVDIQAQVTIDQYDKIPPFPVGLQANQPVNHTPATPTNCEIGVEKTGTDILEITHFKKR